jgi:hypothetical protein
MKYTQNADVRAAAIGLMQAGLVTCAEVARAVGCSRLTANRWAERAPERFRAREAVIKALFAGAIEGAAEKRNREEAAE